MVPLRYSDQRKRRLGAADLNLLAETLILLTAASLKVRFVPFRRITASIARQKVSRHSPPLDVDRLLWAVHAAASRLPLRSKCIETSLCLQAMLSRRGCASTLHYGVRREEDGQIAAHVWLSVGDRNLLGGEAAPEFARVASFPVAARA